MDIATFKRTMYPNAMFRLAGVHRTYCRKDGFGLEFPLNTFAMLSLDIFAPYIEKNIVITKMQGREINI